MPRAVSFDFDLNPGSQADDNEVFNPMLNIVYPAFTTRVKMYLKPKNSAVSCLTLLLIFDTCLSLLYIWAQFAYVVDGHYEDEEDKVVQLLIAFGVTGAILSYCIADAIRFLQTWPDCILYIISCIF